MRCGQPVATPTNDNNVILRLRRRIAPCRSPAAMTAQPFFKYPEARICHGSPFHCSAMRSTKTYRLLLYLRHIPFYSCHVTHLKGRNAVTQTVGFLLLDDYALMSTASAVEPLRAANYLAQQEHYDLRFLSVAGGPVAAHGRLQL